MRYVDADAAVPAAGERRTRGRLVDLRVVLDRPVDGLAMSVLSKVLRVSDTVLSAEGCEVAAALGSTSAEDVARVVVPRLRRKLMLHGYRSAFVLQGRRLG